MLNTINHPISFQTCVLLRVIVDLGSTKFMSSKSISVKLKITRFSYTYWFFFCQVNMHGLNEGRHAKNVAVKMPGVTS